MASFGALLLIGFMMIFSASSVMGLKMGDSFYYLKRHFFYIVIGFVAFNYALKLEISNLKKYANILIYLSFLFLFMLHIPYLGTSLGGATRWLNFYIFSFQPSELAKLAMILFLATKLSKIKDKIKDFKEGLLPLLLVLGLMAGIIIIQPDLGTALSIL